MEESTNIFIIDVVSRDEIGLWYWFWILPFLSIAHILIIKGVLCKTRMNMYFGRSIEIEEFCKGPKLAQDAVEQDENQENIELPVVVGLFLHQNARQKSFDFYFHVEDLSKIAPQIHSAKQ